MDYRLVIIMLLVIIAILLLLLVIDRMLSRQVNIPQRIAPPTQPTVMPSVMPSISYRDDFFSQSSRFAEDFIRGKQAFTNPSSDPNPSRIIEALRMLNTETKESVITAIRFFSVDYQNYATTENMFRQMRSSEKTPLWLIILREALVKVVPSLSIKQDTYDSLAISQSHGN